MQNVSLGRASQLTTTRLGFGTAALLREPRKRRRLDVLAAAVDAGIRHFDTAPTYGFGEAEKLLGEFLARRREPITVATKLGLAVSPAAARLAALQTAARAAIAVIRPLRLLARRHAHRFHSAPRFDLEGARGSFERSRMTLHRDRVDLLLLHECTPATVAVPALLTWLRELCAQGRITAFGTATGVDATAEMLRARPDYCDVVQCPTDAAVPGALQLPDGTTRITHGVFAALPSILAALRSADDTQRQRWAAAVDANVSDPVVLSRLLLQAALLANPHGVVLVQSTSPARIAANAATAGMAIDSGQVAALAALVRSTLDARRRQPLATAQP